MFINNVICFKETVCTMIPLMLSVFIVSISGLKGLPENPQSISAQKCREYGEVFRTPNLQTDCNNRTFSVDKKAKLGEFPFMVALKYKVDNEIRYSCAGALISKNYVIAPAYCLNSPSQGSPIAVRLGQIQVKGDTEILENSAQEIKIIKFQVHPEYNARNKTNIIGLIQLENDVVFNKNVHPICLAEAEVKADKFMSSGWNFISPIDCDESYSGHLLKSMFTRYSFDECKGYYNTGRVTLSENQMCAGPEKSYCQIEPIGTLQVKNENIPCMDTLVAISGFGKSISVSNIPDVFTLVHPYHSWIESIVWT